MPPVKHALRAKVAASKEITNSLCSMSEPSEGRKRVVYYVTMRNRKSTGYTTMAVQPDDEEAIAPPSKRARSSSTRSRTASHPLASEISDSRRLFAPFRALGLITNQVPFALQVRAVKGSAAGPRLHILTCLGNSWALWEGEKMTLLFVGQ